MDFLSALSTNVLFPSLFFLLLDFFVRMWLLNAFLRLILPLPVFLNRFFAPLFVFIFGITSVFSEKLADLKDKNL